MPCPRHRSCRYDADDPTRCPRCHRSWVLIVACQGGGDRHSTEPCASCGGSRKAHRRWHDQRDKRDAAGGRSPVLLTED